MSLKGLKRPLNRPGALLERPLSAAPVSDGVQVLVRAGYHVLSLNYRGSTGYGARFEHSGDDASRALASAGAWSIFDGEGHHIHRLRSWPQVHAATVSLLDTF
ncbi:hypothetical protein COCOR_02928 [Corallococcus coralloides DSM 2259]|uniref:Uncharacterized protein n=1 Tax=Corallococcus coralloides (strain ATCC 25202 / DSM 2259 / NBRC 100086 / M2) TaxID=1144275 RepID=H8MYR9_CORCM|nr:hypothetical protein [Corallococcus coralloides]AFE04926.1 hypothetical protein COCOR_02928 [Corallococcus coralloides DSM 2259]